MEEVKYLYIVAPGDINADKAMYEDKAKFKEKYGGSTR